MRYIIILALILPICCFSQSYDNLDDASKHRVDSLVDRIQAIKFSKDHHKMVSFSEWNAFDLTDFYSYLINDLRYASSDPDGTVNIKPIPTGLTTTFTNVSEGYQQNTEKLKIVFTCKRDGSRIVETKIFAPFSRLVELYIFYFEGGVRKDMPLKGGLDKTYTATDEVKLFDSYIRIRSSRNSRDSN